MFNDGLELELELELEPGVCKALSFAPMNIFELCELTTTPHPDQNITSDLTRARTAVSILHSALLGAHEDFSEATGRSKVYTALGTE